MDVQLERRLLKRHGTNVRMRARFASIHGIVVRSVHNERIAIYRLAAIAGRVGRVNLLAVLVPNERGERIAATAATHQRQCVSRAYRLSVCISALYGEKTRAQAHTSEQASQRD